MREVAQNMDSGMANYYAMITGEGHGTVRHLPGFRDPLVRYRLSLRTDMRDLGRWSCASWRR